MIKQPASAATGDMSSLRMSKRGRGRRRFLRNCGLAALGLAAGPTLFPRRSRAAPVGDAPLILTVVIPGGIDQRTLFDPVTVARESINDRGMEWVEIRGVRATRPLESFLTTHGGDVRTVVGIDMLRQPPHTAIHMTTGRYAPGFPHFGALHAVNVGAQALPLPVLNYATGTEMETRGLVTAVGRLSLSELDRLGTPETRFGHRAEQTTSRTLRDRVENYVRDRAAAESDRFRGEEWVDGIAKIDALQGISAAVAEVQGIVPSATNDVEADAITCLGAFYSGATVSAQIETENFDTHGRPVTSDDIEGLAALFETIVGGAKTLGLWERLTVVVVSDFTRKKQRTGIGTDHHTQNALAVFRAGVNADGRGTIGYSDDLQRSSGLRESTLEPGGTAVPTIYDAQRWLRELLNIDSSLVELFPLDDFNNGNPAMRNPLTTAL